MVYNLPHKQTTKLLFLCFYTFIRCWHDDVAHEYRLTDVSNKLHSFEGKISKVKKFKG